MFKDKFSSLVSKSGSKLAGLKEALRPAGSSLVEEVPEQDIDIEAHQSSRSKSKNDSKEHLEETYFTSLDGILTKILQIQIQQISFIHEIGAGKWVYYGQYLEHYPQIYFNVCDRLSFQDLACIQTLLCLDNCDELQQTLTSGEIGNNLMNFMINHFGLDGQLQTLFKCLKSLSLSKADFKKFDNFDAQKLRMQLIFFMRFLAQVCIHEVAFLKQIHSRKDDRIETVSSGHNNKEVRKLWAQAVKKEAVHLLLLNKVNVSIQSLKQDMIEIFPKDEIFEEMLFEVST